MPTANGVWDMLSWSNDEGLRVRKRGGSILQKMSGMELFCMVQEQSDDVLNIAKIRSANTVLN